MFLLGFILGIFLGAPTLALVLCLLTTAKLSDEDMERTMKKNDAD